MLNKLLKYDLESVYKVLSVFYILSILVAILTRIFCYFICLCKKLHKKEKEPFFRFFFLIFYLTSTFFLMNIIPA